MQGIRSTALAFALSFVPAPLAAAGDDEAAKALEKLELRFETTDLPWMKAYEEFLPEYAALAKRYPGTEQALTAELRVLKFTGRFQKDKAKMQAEAAVIVDRILAEHPTSPQLVALTDLMYLFGEEKRGEIWNLLRKPDQPPEVKAAILLRDLRARVGGKQPDEAKRILEEILAKYKDLPKGWSTCGEIADAVANPHDPANLVVGADAPDIVGKDIDGKPMRLSDYKGKVVVIDFFGDW